jgi:hypothetical protein
LGPGVSRFGDVHRLGAVFHHVLGADVSRARVFEAGVALWRVAADIGGRVDDVVVAGFGLLAVSAGCEA